MHCTNVIHSLNVVIAERANWSTIHHSPFTMWLMERKITCGVDSLRWWCSMFANEEEMLCM